MQIFIKVFFFTQINILYNYNFKGTKRDKLGTTKSFAENNKLLSKKETEEKNVFVSENTLLNNLKNV